MPRVFNFSPGPAMLPEPVMRQVRDELLDWQRTGMSVMELPHRGDKFRELAAQAEQDLRDLLNIPEHYTVLFMPGGATSQFAMIPMNLLEDRKTTAYVQTGVWSRKAVVEAKKYSNVVISSDSEGNNFTTIAEQHTWDVPDDAAYLYYADNETVNGIEFPYVPNVGDIPLVCDMSSNLLSRPVDVTKYGLIYATAQKNMGPAGLTTVIIRDDLLQRKPHLLTPSTFRYDLYAKEKSMPNTPVTFAWYVAGLVFQWAKKEGGLVEMAERCERRSCKLNEFIDQSAFYNNPVDPIYRSRINVIFRLADDSLEATFLKDAEKGGLTNLKGHRFIGGMRASMYNSMPEIGVDTLIAFMRDFESQYG